MRERLRRLAATLYPQVWRERYGEEFAALLEDSPARWGDVLDIAKGGIMMRFKQPTWKMAAWMGLAGLLVAGAASLASPGFDASARIQATNAEAVPYLAKFALSRSALSELIRNFGLYETEVRRKPLEDVIEGMRHDIRLERDNVGFRIQFRYPDAKIAKGVTEALVAQFMYENARQASLKLLGGSTLSMGSDVDVVSARGVSPSTLLWGLGLGLLAAVIVTQPFRRTLRMTGFSLAGFAVVLALMYTIPVRYRTTAIVALRAETAPPVGVQAREMLELGRSPKKIYELAAEGTDRFGIQRQVIEAIRKLPFEAKDVIDPPTLPTLPVWPNRLFASLLGAGAALLLGIGRTRPAPTIAQ